MKLVSLIMVLAALAGAADKASRRETSGYVIGPSIQPLVIYGEGWSQQFTIINVDYYQGGEPTVGTLKFYTKDGQPWKLPIRGRGSVDQIPVSLQPGQMLVVETEVSQQPQQLGWALFDLVDNINQWGIYHAVTVFRKQADGRPDLMTNVPFVDDLEDELIVPFDNRDGKYPGLGLVNNSTLAGTFTLRVHNASGVLIKTFTRNVKAMGLDWFSLVGDYPDLAGIQGQIKISGPFFSGTAFTLQFTPNGAFTALPVVHTFGMNE